MRTVLGVCSDTDDKMSRSKKDKRGGHVQRHAPKWFRKMMERRKRAQVKAALKSGREIPVIKKDADWHWW